MDERGWRNVEQTTLLYALTAAWVKHPDLRLGQLVESAPYFRADGTNEGYSPPSFFVSDERMLAGLRGLTLND